MNFTEKLLDASRKNIALQNFGFQVISQASGFSSRCLLLLLLPRREASRRKLEPPLFETMSVLGRELCLERIEIALAKLGD